jgi:hypothetical protein
MFRARRKIAQYIADVQLQRCVEWLKDNGYRAVDAGRMQAAMRPEPSSLKKQALERLKLVQSCLGTEGRVYYSSPQDLDVIREAIESIPDN